MPSAVQAEETLTDAVVPVFVGVIELLLAWWRSEQDEGEVGGGEKYGGSAQLCVMSEGDRRRCGGGYRNMRGELLLTG
jgi:hypothetical protein